MHSDHVSDVTSHDQSAHSVQRIGSCPGSTFVDRGLHPSLGTRNFSLHLQNSHYLEIVSSFEHPASDSLSFGKAISKRVTEDGGWLTWVVSVGHVTKVEIAGDGKRIIEWLGSNIQQLLGVKLRIYV